MQRKFIEYDLPLEEISEESAREKNIHHGHPSTLHIWWARKPLAASRAIALATLLNDPGEENSNEREEIKDLIKEAVSWEEVKSGNSKSIEDIQQKIRDQYGEAPPKVLDPFAGGGSIPLEVLRLGSETYASDYNPVAVFIEKATVEWPQKFGVEVEIPKNSRNEEVNTDGLSLDSKGNKVNLLSFMVERWANKVLEETKDEIGHFYPEESGAELVGSREVTKKEGWVPVGYYYNRIIPCQNPTCNAEIPLTSNYWLAKKDNKRIAYRPLYSERGDLSFELLNGEEIKTATNNGFKPNDGTVTYGKIECPKCGNVISGSEVMKLGQNGKISNNLSFVIFHHPDQRGKKYRVAKNKDKELYDKSKEVLQEKKKTWEGLESPLPEEKIFEGNLDSTPQHLWVNKYGYRKFKDLFNSRQSLFLLTFMNKIRSSYERIEKESEKIFEINQNVKIDPKDLAKAVLGYLSNILNMQAAFNNNIARWENTTEAIKHVFSMQALPMLWDYVELNPFSGSSGSVKSGLKYYLKYIKFASFQTNGSCKTGENSATKLQYSQNFFDAVLTDPPYYDNVPYSALSNFFYVWLKRTLGEYYPNLFSTPLVPKSQEAIMEPRRHESKAEAKDFFEEKLGKSFQEIHRVLKPGGIATIVYAHKTTEGWETMLNGLVEAGFVVTASWPVHTEMKNRLRAAQSAALASSIYMVCRKTEREKLGFWKDIKPEIETKVQEKLEQFWKEGIIGGDIFISAIGPGMEIFSQYEEIQKYSGKKVSTRELLAFIRSITTDFVVNRLLKEASPSEIDKESQFYLAYRWTYLDNKVEYDAARKIASGMGADIEKMDDETGFVKKTRKYVRVYGPKDRTDYDGKITDIEISSMVDAMHKSLLLWEAGRKDEINEVLTETGYAEQGSFWQFCQAVSESLIQGNDEKKKLEGFLMGRDKYVQSAKAMNEQAEKTKDMFKEE